MPTRRNILFLVADDLGRQLGVLGDRIIRSPRLDALAREGVCFDQAFCTTASCSASRSVMYSGLHNHQSGHYGHIHGFHHFHTFDWVRTLPRILGDAGWRTGLLNKKHVGGREVYPWQVEREGGSRDGQAIARQAEEFFTARDDRPFALTIGYIDPHRDHTRSGFGNQDYPGIDRRVYRPEEVPVPSFLPDLPEVRAELAEYYQSVDRLDQGVGMVLDALARSGHADETLVLFISDNGLPFINSKTTLYDAGIHLPFLLRVPGGATGVRNPNLVSYVDILPTFLDWAGIPDEADTLRRGRSLLPIAGETRALPAWGEVFASHTFHGVTEAYPTRVLRERRWKYHKNVWWKLDFPFASDLYASRAWEAIRKAGCRIGQRSVEGYLRRPLEELYDLEADPHEICNLAGDPAHEQRLRSMRARVEAWQLATRDPWLYRDGTSLIGIEHYMRHEGMQVPEAHDMVAVLPSARAARKP
jgi:N-sulfoglucosamine sulfohydrolase